ncbi:hypothetical protein X809_01355 [Paenibacillus polymyxa CR1]|uniref:Uncharacterized protein n=1 Tax=Paenibacillus polymyxa TaxID=1406 RepID=A0ABX2ZHU4_PAEPO|nr:hypothetical protein X809_01355 [Paenibacillus polymyxa CR1]ALA40319.1 hypothetical protein ABE82_01605 [Paenibacillus peoriae]APB77986.1 hypothetical protein PPYC2_25025 [Paenibacillus polymyxa]ODA11339.1 hypothetical protein A7312_20265 [Paenibacillus polymyxa]OME68208.1 hypothetical protein BK119_17425 [Paenibacillus peoriae]
MIPNVLFIIRIPPEMIGLPIMQYDNGFKYEDFAKIQLATSNEQYIERNGLVHLYIAFWSDWNRILQNPDACKYIAIKAYRYNTYVQSTRTIPVNRNVSIVIIEQIETVFNRNIIFYSLRIPTFFRLYHLYYVI